MENFLNKLLLLWHSSKTSIGVFLISVFSVVYGIILYITNPFHNIKGFKELIEDVSLFVPVCGAIIGTIIGVIDMHLFLSDYFEEKRKEAFEEGLNQGRKEDLNQPIVVSPELIDQETVIAINSNSFKDVIESEKLKISNSYQEQSL